MVPLFAGSVCVFVVQAHLLLPPLLSRRRSPSPLTIHARLEDWPVYYILEDCLPPDANIMQDGVHPALLEHIAGGWVKGMLGLHPCMGCGRDLVYAVKRFVDFNFGLF